MALYIGIDPGKHNGWAEWDSRQKCLLAVESIERTTVLERLANKYTPEQRAGITVIIEDPEGNSLIFDKRLYAAIGPDYRQQLLGSNMGKKALSVAQDVGGNKITGKIFIEWATLLGFKVVPITPRGSKWDAALFKRYTNWPGRTNEHGRDAARHVFGR